MPSVFELVRARLVWIFIVQQAHFKNDIKYLESGRDIEDSSLKSIEPCMDKNLLKVGGRVQASSE